MKSEEEYLKFCKGYYFNNLDLLPDKYDIKNNKELALFTINMILIVNKCAIKLNIKEKISVFTLILNNCKTIYKILTEDSFLIINSDDKNIIGHTISINDLKKDILS